MRDLLVASLSFFIICWSTLAEDCPARELTLGGSSNVYVLAVKWADAYKDVCQATRIKLDEAPVGTEEGANRLCNESAGSEDSPLLDINGMSRHWELEEASPINTFIYRCISSTRQAVQVDVAIEAVVVAVGRDGEAADCIKKLGGGLTVGQLRWIFSDQSLTQLIYHGFDVQDVPNFDDNDRTHLWSEMHPECAETEILIAGSDRDSEAYEHFKDSVFGGSASPDEIPFGGRKNGNTTIPYFNGTDDELIQFLDLNSAAISFFSFSYSVRNSDIVEHVAIKNRNGEFVQPTATSMYTGDYEPLSRRLHMNVWNNAEVLAAVRPFFEFAFSDLGTGIVESTGYAPIPEFEQEVMLARLGTAVVDGNFGCGPSGVLTVVGSSAVKPIADFWAGIYQAKCRNSVISIKGGDSALGASRVCGTSGEPVDIGTMSRGWLSTEATTSNGYNFHCAGSDRSVIQLAIALDGLTVALSRGSNAEKCISKLRGLSMDQLRWIYSSYDENQLAKSGWDPKSIANSDSDPDSRLWSELLDDPACHQTAIRIGGPDPLSGTYDLFASLVFADASSGETYAHNRNFSSIEDDDDLVQFLVNNDDAISFFGYASFTQKDHDALFAVPIRNDRGAYTTSNDLSVRDGTKYPLARSLYMNLLDDEASLKRTRKFLEFGLSDEGSELVRIVGFAPIDPFERVMMKTRAQIAGGYAAESVKGVVCGPPGQEIQVAGTSEMLPIAIQWASVYELACDVVVEVAGGRSASGAARLCGEVPAVDIGMMSRSWKPAEAKVRRDGHTYDCLFHDPQRSTLQIAVAIDGVTVAVARNSVAQECIDLMGGLTLDQLRWIFSSYNHSQLEASDWDASALGGSDDNDSTHKWSELDSRCADTEILIAGPDNYSARQEFFMKTILKDHGKGEGFGRSRPTGYHTSAVDSELLRYTTQHPAAISYFNYAYYFSQADSLYAAPIQNTTGAFVAPDALSIDKGSYTPLSRRVYMNLYSHAASLKNTVPFMKFGFSSLGLELLKLTGYVPIPAIGAGSQYAMKQILLEASNHAVEGDIQDAHNADEGLPPVLLAVILIGALIVSAVIFYVALSHEETIEEVGEVTPEERQREKTSLTAVAEMS